jgi:hypothetical protein
MVALLAASILTAGAVQAQTGKLERRGFFGGLDFGVGAGQVQYEQDGVQYDSEEKAGAGLGLRLGYAFNPYFSLSADVRGFGMEDDDLRYGIGSSALVATVYPAGGGFFLRVGAGGARLETEFTDDADRDLVREFDERGAIVTFGLGYEWLVNEHFSLGLALDARGGMVEDFGDIEDVEFGESTLGLSMNYFF